MSAPLPCLRTTASFFPHQELLKLAKAKYLKASKVVERIVDYSDEQAYEQSQALQASGAQRRAASMKRLPGSADHPLVHVSNPTKRPYSNHQLSQVSCYLNMALCATKQREAAEAIHYCNKALE